MDERFSEHPAWNDARFNFLWEMRLKIPKEGRILSETSPSTTDKDSSCVVDNVRCRSVRRSSENNRESNIYASRNWYIE